METNLLKKHAKSFYWASFFLSNDVFSKCSSLYNFCRTLDDIVDNDNKLEVKKEIFLKFKKDFLNKVAKKYGVEPEEVQHIIDHPNDYSFTPPAAKEDRHAQLLNLTIMMMIDDVIDDHEMAMLKKFAIGLGYPIFKVDKLIQVAIKCVKADMDEEEAMDELDEA